MKLIKNVLISVAFFLNNLFGKRLNTKTKIKAQGLEAMNEFFDKVWVLTIPRNTERQSLMRKKFTGLNFDFFTGADGKKLAEGDDRIDLGQAAKNNNRIVRVNELACTLSHIMMFEEIVKKGYKRVMIFEDDAVFLKKKAKWIPYSLSRLPDNWDVLYMGYRDGELRGFAQELKEALPFFNKTQDVVSRHVGKGLRTAAGHDYTHAYCVTLEGAQKLLREAYPIRFTADGWLEYNVLTKNINAYITIPKIFVQQEDLGSSIHS